MGKWFEIYRDMETKFEEGAECVTAQYTLNQDSSITVLNSQYLVEEAEKTNITGTAHCTGAQCSVKFFTYAPAGDYRVVATDYEDFSIVYSCNDILGIAKLEYLWILSRQHDIELNTNLGTTWDEIKEIIEREIPNFDYANRLRKTYQ